jgi:hypothetical protein
MQYNLSLLLDCDASIFKALWTARKHLLSLQKLYQRELDECFLEYDSETLDYPEGLIVRSLAMTESKNDPLHSIPDKFKK